MAKKNKRKAAQAARRKAVEPNRRSALKILRNGGIAAGVALGAGYVGRQWFLAYLDEHDLTRIGQGKPAVVQIHDPQCPTCTALQRETKKAMKQFGECDLIYLVADIKQPEGAALAQQYGVGHVTLLLFDARGKVADTLQGMRTRRELEPLLAAHFARYGTT